VQRMRMTSSPGSRVRGGGEGPELRLSLMEGFDLRRNGDPVLLPGSAQRVVAYLALHERPVLRPHLAASLWLDTPEDRALANLRSALWRLRRPGLAIVEAGGDQVWLSPRVTVDYRELSELARSMLAADDPVLPGPAERLVLAGEMLPGWYDDWVLVERERFRQRRLHALERACGSLARAGDFGRAIDACLAAVTAEPLRETAHLGLIEAHLAEGNRVEALRQFETYRRLMRDELGLPPSAQVVAVIRNIATEGEAGGRVAATGVIRGTDPGDRRSAGDGGGSARPVTAQGERLR
jgi:DNA-binding SARP family transcriptional activator